MTLLQCDVTNESDVNATFLNISSQGDNRDITGIWHLSMVLRDALYLNMSKEQWYSVIRLFIMEGVYNRLFFYRDTCVQAKVHAAELLDKYSRLYAPTLKTFVMFSSISSLYGNGGQTNYAYANACMEVLGLKRKSCGLPATVICWGRIGNVGWVIYVRQLF